MRSFMNFSMSSHQDKSIIFHMIFHILVASCWFNCFHVQHSLYIHHHSSHFDDFDAWLRKQFARHLAGWIEAVKSARQRLDVDVTTLEIQRARSGFCCFRVNLEMARFLRPVFVTIHFDVLHMEVQIVYPWVPTNWWQDQTCLWQRCDIISFAWRFKGDLKKVYYTVRIKERYVVCT